MEIGHCREFLKLTFQMLPLCQSKHVFTVAIYDIYSVERTKLSCNTLLSTQHHSFISDLPAPSPPHPYFIGNKPIVFREKKHSSMFL